MKKQKEETRIGYACETCELPIQRIVRSQPYCYGCVTEKGSTQMVRVLPMIPDICEAKEVVALDEEGKEVDRFDARRVYYME